jgi:hypothetical protein
MRVHPGNFVVASVLFVAARAPAAVLYVGLNSTNPTAPYADWNTAATNIQDAVDAASAGDLILVTNGVYQSGGRLVPPDVTTNRVAIDKAVTVQSVNGPATTMIQGYHGGISGPTAYLDVRCVYLTNEALLVGFTLTNGGSEQNGGGIWCETNAMVTNCVVTAGLSFDAGGGGYQGNYYNCAFISNTAVYYGGGAASSTLINCTVTGNLQWHGNYGNGGGAYSCTLSNCTLTGNNSAAGDRAAPTGGGGASYSSLVNCALTGNLSGNSGGGAHNSSLTNCMVISNSASQWGGGTYNCALENCTLTGNSARFGQGGGGAAYGTLNNCTLTQNRADLNAGGGAVNATLVNCKLFGNLAYGGGGAEGSILENCLVISNTASLDVGHILYGYGGGVYACALTNCTVAGNSSIVGGGTYGSALYNCIVYSNTAPTNSNYDTSDSFVFCCTTPLPTNGANNIASDPLFLNPFGGDYHLQSNSPCLNSGNNAYVTVTNDLDGNPRIVGGTVDIGAYEYQTPSSVISYAWLQQYDLLTDGSADFADSDGSGMNNWQKWIAGLNPTNPASVLAMQTPVVTNNATGVTVSWSSVNTRSYYLQRANDLTAQPAFSAIQSNIVGQAGTTSYTDITATNGGPFFYRVGVQ